MSAKKYITCSCSISNNTVYRNGKQVFVNDANNTDDFLLSVYRNFHYSYPKFYKMDNLCKLGWLAAEILLKNFDTAYYNAEQVGTVLTNANSSLDTDLKYYKGINNVPSPSLFVYTLPNIVAGEICIRHHFKGENTFFVQPKFDTGFVKQQVNYLLDSNILQACICGWVDILEQEYEAKLFLIEKVNKENAKEFDLT